MIPAAMKWKSAEKIQQRPFINSVQVTVRVIYRPRREIVPSENGLLCGLCGAAVPQHEARGPRRTHEISLRGDGEQQQKMNHASATRRCFFFMRILNFTSSGLESQTNDLRGKNLFFFIELLTCDLCQVKVALFEGITSKPLNHSESHIFFSRHFSAFELKNEYFIRLHRFLAGGSNFRDVFFFFFLVFCVNRPLSSSYNSEEAS